MSDSVVPTPGCSPIAVATSSDPTCSTPNCSGTTLNTHVGHASECVQHKRFERQ